MNIDAESPSHISSTIPIRGTARRTAGIPTAAIANMQTMLDGPLLAHESEVGPSLEAGDGPIEGERERQIGETQYPFRRRVLQSFPLAQYFRQVRDVHVRWSGVRQSLSHLDKVEEEAAYTLMVVVKWTSALAVTRTRRRTGLDNAEPSPTLPFMAVVPRGIISVELREVVDPLAAGCWVKFVFVRAGGRGALGCAMILDGRRWMCGALAAFCRTVNGMSGVYK